MTLQAVTLVGPPEVTGADVAQDRNLPELPATIPALSDPRFGPNAALRPGGADFWLVATVADHAAFHARLDSPPHRKMPAATADGRHQIRRADPHGRLTS